MCARGVGEGVGKGQRVRGGRRQRRSSLSTFSLRRSTPAVVTVVHWPCRVTVRRNQFLARVSSPPLARALPLLTGQAQFGSVRYQRLPGAQGVILLLRLSTGSRGHVQLHSRSGRSSHTHPQPPLPSKTTLAGPFLLSVRSRLTPPVR